MHISYNDDLKSIAGVVQASMRNEACAVDARHGSLIMDEMSIKQGVAYQMEADSVHGLVQLGGLETQYEQRDEVATHLLCLVIVGLSSHYRLSWLENDFLDYFLVWKDNAPAKAAFLSEETYEALCITTASTVACTKHLLERGYHFVLMSRYSSDDVEALFSTVRQLNGQNDQTDARAALSSLQKILEHLNQDCKPAHLDLAAGFLVRAVQDNISCLGCLDTVKVPASSSPTTALIVNIDRGGLFYPRLSFVGFVINLERAASASVTALLKSRRPVQQFLGAVLPAVCRNPLLQCEHDSSEDHRRALATVIERKFMTPFFVNHTRNVSETKRKKNLKGKPESRKVLKV
ncbi:hypothetical protein HPB47_016017 [Ixodes persulcatus]|uniref:Uncharacterized protein n=1 Tax=Ixodes persulcatus TaxID=34615 RepID=A0AC60QS18_IXOPE|nr:hypothetical protein HPB47_016017 [Ixodes persulcatus]